MTTGLVNPQTYQTQLHTGNPGWPGWG